MNNPSAITALDWLLYTFKRNPEGVLLLGAAAVLLMRQGSGAASASSGGLSGASDKIGEVRNAAGDLANGAIDHMNAMTASATTYAKEATQRINENSAQLMTQAQNAAQKTFDEVRQNQPLSIVLAGVAVGAAIASLLKISQFENETIGPTCKRISDAAVDKVKGAAVTAGETLKDAMDDRGLNAEGLKEVASEVLEAAAGSIGRRGNGRDRDQAQHSSTRSEE